MAATTVHAFTQHQITKEKTRLSDDVLKLRLLSERFGYSPEREVATELTYNPMDWGNFTASRYDYITLVFLTDLKPEALEQSILQMNEKGELQKPLRQPSLKEAGNPKEGYVSATDIGDYDTEQAFEGSRALECDLPAVKDTEITWSFWPSNGYDTNLEYVRARATEAATCGNKSLQPGESLTVISIKQYRKFGGSWNQ